MQRADSVGVNPSSLLVSAPIWGHLRPVQGAQIFVYGTLKRGEVAHHFLTGATFVSTAKTDPTFTLVDCGWYPGLVREGQTAIEGEVYCVSERLLVFLDEFEDVPSLYTRTLSSFEGAGFAWIYILRTDRSLSFPRLRTSCWRGASHGH